MDWPRSERAIEILSDLGIDVDCPSYFEAIASYHRLCSTWNLSAKLLSKRDLAERFDEHVADSLSLLPGICAWRELHSGILTDIGTGGGFPAFPLAMALPGLRADLIERSEVKCQFLRQASRVLPLGDVRVHQGSFPDILVGAGPRIIVARAIEKPEQVDRNILMRLRPDDLYLAQRDVNVGDSGEFSRELIEDTFTVEDLRRGTLLTIRRVPPSRRST